MSKKKHKYLPSQKTQAEKVIQRQEGQEELAKEIVGIIHQSFSGPIPPPNILSEYSQIIPNGAERIMAMAEAQSEHRRKLETKALKTDSRNSLLGVIFAFILGITALFTGALIVYIGKSVSGTIFGSTGMVTLVSAFIYGTRERRKERESKAKNK